MSFDYIGKREFYELLMANEEFCKTLGQLMLVAGQLEVELGKYLVARGEGEREKATLGQLVSALKKRSFLTANGKMHFDDLVQKRNYLSHSIFDLFDGNLKPSILPSKELVKEDVEYYIDCISCTLIDFRHFTNKVSDNINGTGGPLL